MLTTVCSKYLFLTKWQFLNSIHMLAFEKDILITGFWSMSLSFSSSWGRNTQYTKPEAGSCWFTVSEVIFHCQQALEQRGMVEGSAQYSCSSHGSQEAETKRGSQEAYIPFKVITPMTYLFKQTPTNNNILSYCINEWVKSLESIAPYLNTWP